MSIWCYWCSFFNDQSLAYFWLLKFGATTSCLCFSNCNLKSRKKVGFFCIGLWFLNRKKIIYYWRSVFKFFRWSIKRVSCRKFTSWKSYWYKWCWRCFCWWLVFKKIKYFLRPVTYKNIFFYFFWFVRHIYYLIIVKLLNHLSWWQSDKIFVFSLICS